MKKVIMALAFVSAATVAQAGQEQYPETTSSVGTSRPNAAGSAESTENSQQRLIYVPVVCPAYSGDGVILDVCRAGANN